MKIATLRAQAFERAGGYCEWPTCDQPAKELAHLHSRGMGGSKTADRLDNVMAACWLHARITDGHHPASKDETVRMFGRLGYKWNWAGSLAWHRAEALTDYLKERQ